MISTAALAATLGPLFCFFPAASYAAGVSSVMAAPAGLRYFAVAKDPIPQASTLARLRELAKHAGLHVVTDRLLTDDELDRTVLISLRRLNPEFEGKILSHPAGLSVQKTMGGEVVALFFIGFKADEVTRVLSKYEGAYASMASVSSRSPASETVGSAPAASASAEEKSYARELVGSFIGCGKGLIQGFNAVTVDPFISAGKSLKGLSEIGWNQYWENSKREFSQAVDAVRNYEKTIAKGVTGYRDMSVAEKSAFNCSLAGGGGAGGIAQKAAQKIATRAVAAEAVSSAAATEAAVAEAITESTAVQAARRSANQRFVDRQRFSEKPDPAAHLNPPKTPEVTKPASANPAATDVDGLVVREWSPVPASKDIVPVTPEEFIKIHGDFDPSKVRRAPEPKRTAAPVKAGDGKWYRSIFDVGNGNVTSVNYKILETKPSGKVVIEFENPMQRGRMERREMLPGELRRGLREIDPPSVPPSSGGF